MKIIKNDLKIKDSGPGTFIFEKSAKNYVQRFNESFSNPIRADLVQKQCSWDPLGPSIFSPSRALSRAPQ